MFYIISGLIGVLLVAADQLSKVWAVRFLEPVGTMPAVPGLFNFTFLENGNTGGAWGIFSGRQGMLILLSAVLMLVILYLIISKKITNHMAVVSLVLVLAGGIGNLIDRLRQGFVVDFIQFDFWKSFPIFNVADICVTIGIILFCVYILFIDGKEKKEKAE